MRFRTPLSVIVIGWLYIAVGAFGLIFHLTEVKPQHPFQYDIVWISLINVVAIVCGVYLLRGANWARWLAIAWMGFHVVVSVFDRWSALTIHTLLFAALAYFLFLPQASRYFRGTRTQAT